MTDVVFVAVIGAISAFSTGWLHWQINRNACGGAKCLKTIKEALTHLSDDHKAKEQELLQ